MPFEKGDRADLPKTGGRKKGIPNKITKTVREAIATAFDEVGGKDYLVGIARDDPRTFSVLIGKLLPLEVAGSLKVAISHEDALDELE